MHAALPKQTQVSYTEFVCRVQIYEDIVGYKIDKEHEKDGLFYNCTGVLCISFL